MKKYWRNLILFVSTFLAMTIPVKCLADPPGDSQTDSATPNVERYGSAQYQISPDDLPPELQKRLEKYRPEPVQISKDFRTIILKLLEEDRWLAESFADPEGTPLVREDGSNVGPTTREIAQAGKPFCDAMRDDYLENSNDDESVKRKLVKAYELNIVDLNSGRVPDLDAQDVIFGQFENGNSDPFVLYLNLLFRYLTNENRTKILNRVGESLRSRKCDPTATFLLVCECSRQSRTLSENNRAYLTERLLETIPQQLRKHAGDDSSNAVLVYRILQGFALMNKSGRIDLIEELIKIREQAGGESIVNDFILHRLLASLYNKIASTARGGGVMSTVSQEDYQIFTEYGERFRDHVIKAFNLEPKDNMVAKELIQLDMRWGMRVLDSSQAFRLAMLSQCDSEWTASWRGSSLMPRWGGSQQQLEDFITKLIGFSKHSADNKFLFYSSLQDLSKDTGPLVNFDRNTGLAQGFADLCRSMDKINHGKPDPRVSNYEAFSIPRILWDASLLEERHRFIESHRDVFETAFFYDWGYQLQFSERFSRVFSSADDAKEDLLVIHRELVCGDENWNPDRLAKIDRSLGRFRNYAETIETSNSESNLNNRKMKIVEATEASTNSDQQESPSDATAVLLKQLEALYEIVYEFELGKEVELLGNVKSTLWYIGGSDGEVSYPKDGTIVIESSCDQQYQFLHHPLRLPSPHTIEMEVETISGEGDPYGVALFSGQVAPQSTTLSQTGMAIRMIPGKLSVSTASLPKEMDGGPDFHTRSLTAVPERVTLRLEMREEASRAFFDGDLVSEIAGPSETRGHLMIGRWIARNLEGNPNSSAKYKIVGVRIKKLLD
ncbi:MAG: hypothetical protein AAF802_20365 [Planctomycetota bacterium]